MTLPLLNMQSALVRVTDKNGNDIGKGYIINPWNSFFQQFTQQAPAVQSISLTGSPFSYQANENGSVIISGGTVSAIALIRGLITMPLTTTRPLQVVICIGDIVRITYTVAPTIQFLGAQ